MYTPFYFLKCLLNDIFYLTETDIFASFICEMIYKRRLLSHQIYQKKFLCSSGKLLLLFYYIYMVTYCVGYKHFFV